jgi:hypothetical protein
MKRSRFSKEQIACALRLAESTPMATCAPPDAGPLHQGQGAISPRPAGLRRSSPREDCRDAGLQIARPPHR